MKTLRINAFKAYPQYGKVAYDLVTDGHTAITGCFSIRHLAESVKACVNTFFEINKGEKIDVIINLTPLCDIEKAPEASYRYFEALTKTEKAVFWDHFKKD